MINDTEADALDSVLVLNGVGLHEEIAQAPACRAKLLHARRLNAHDVVVETALLADCAQDADGHAGADEAAKGVGPEALAVDVGAPGALGADLVVLGDVAADTRAEVSVEACVGLLVDEARAEGVRWHAWFTPELVDRDRPEMFGGFVLVLGGRRGEGSAADDGYRS